MAISKTKIAFSIFTTSLTAGSIALLSRNYSAKDKEEIPIKTKKVKLATKYSNSLIDEGNMWEYRFKDLKIGNPKNKKLLMAKQESYEFGPWKVQEACQEIINSEEDTEWFDDFQNFCVMKNKDESKLINNESGFDSKYSVFSKFDVKQLSKGFAEIWLSKENVVNDNWRRKMLLECQRLQNKMFVGDAEDVNFGNFCVLP